MNLTNEYKNKVTEAILEARKNFEGSDAAFSKQLNINNAIFSRIKNGERDKVLADGEWLQIGKKYGVTLNQKTWKTAKTDVFKKIESDILYCKEFSKAQIFIDEVGIGKSHTAKYLAKTLKNCFYVDCKQAKSKQQFVRLIAQTIGLDNTGKYVNLKETLKYYIKTLTTPLIILDDTGYLDYSAYVELLELWDATEGSCGWYQIGDDALREKINRGINHKKIGYKAIFSRYSKRYSTVTPTDRNEKIMFYKKMIEQVISANTTAQEDIQLLVKQCLITDDMTGLGDLRRAESLLILYERNKNNGT